MSTLFIPLCLAALGIVLRGAGFAFHESADRLGARRFAEHLFAASSVITPFFMGTVVGAIASGRVPVGNAAGDPVSSWLNPVSVLVGVLFVATGAYLAAVFLVSDARRTNDDDLERYFRVRAMGAAVVTGAIALAGIFVLRADARYVYDGLTSEGIPLVILSAVCGLGAVALLQRAARRGARELAVGAVVAIIWGWGVAQYPYLLPTDLTIAAGAGTDATHDDGPDRLRRCRDPRDPVDRAALHAHAAKRARLRGRGRVNRRIDRFLGLWSSRWESPRIGEGLGAAPCGGARRLPSPPLSWCQSRRRRS